MKNFMIWTLRVMVLAAAIMMVYSFVKPWWVCIFDEANYIWIYGWGLRYYLVRNVELIANDVTPLYQTVLAWMYISISIILMGFSVFIKNKWNTFLLGTIGIGYFVYALVAVYVVIARRASEVGLALQGQGTLIGPGYLAQSVIQHGFYLALATGAFIVLIAVFRFVFDRITTRCRPFRTIPIPTGR